MKDKMGFQGKSIWQKGILKQTKLINRGFDLQQKDLSYKMQDNMQLRNVINFSFLTQNRIKVKIEVSESKRFNKLLVLGLHLVKH